MAPLCPCPGLRCKRSLLAVLVCGGFATHPLFRFRAVFLAGPITHWPASLRATMLDRYTFVHFTPVQELGASGSAYR